MAFTPLVRWRNFNLSNFKTILDIYPDLSNKLSRKDADALLESTITGYKKTAYQYACQLGLENRSVEYLDIHDYLFTFSDENLEKYLRFWLQTYYAPNPYVKDFGKPPKLIFLEAAQQILDSEALMIDFRVFLTGIGGSGSEDILLNVISLYGDPIKKRKIDKLDYLYIEPNERGLLLNIINKIKAEFPIPYAPLDRKSFFERYKYENFARFYDFSISLDTIIKDNKEQYAVDHISTKINKDYQRILVGAPGTGKSYRLKIESEGGNDYPRNFYDNNIEHITFHPNYSFQQFVGTYKPRSTVNTMSKQEDLTISVAQPSISYQYVPGPLLRLLVRALLDYEKNGERCFNYLLIIEEINRTHAAGVFGDLFQLLDRDSTGWSEYGISCSEEMGVYLKESGLIDIKKLKFPPNFYIWATMNNADQGVHPMDTAFKRRWNFEYVDINENESEIAEIYVNINGYGLCEWNEFRKSLNQLLIEKNVKEDKLIGPFFINKTDLLDSSDSSNKENRFQRAFKYKLLMYLADDVFKHNKKELFGELKTCSQIISSYESGEVQIFKGLRYPEANEVDLNSHMPFLEG